jgi:hypothetical protein
MTIITIIISILKIYTMDFRDKNTHKKEINYTIADHVANLFKKGKKWPKMIFFTKIIMNIYFLTQKCKQN